MFGKAWARARIAFGHDAKTAAVTETLLKKLQTMKVDVDDLDLDRPSDAFEALRRIAADSPMMHGEAPELA
jgi:hypothetical protein